MPTEHNLHDDAVLGNLIAAAAAMADLGVGHARRHTPTELAEAQRALAGGGVAVLIVELHPTAPVVSMRIVGGESEHEIFRYETKALAET